MEDRPDETTPVENTTEPTDNDSPPVDEIIDTSADTNDNNSDGSMEDRLERLGGEPAPAITPEEFARLQQAGQVHIDSRGRVKTARRSDAEAGVSLRKRRAWYDRS